METGPAINETNIREPKTGINRKVTNILESPMIEELLWLNLEWDFVDRNAEIFKYSENLFKRFTREWIKKAYNWAEEKTWTYKTESWQTKTKTVIKKIEKNPNLFEDFFEKGKPPATLENLDYNWLGKYHLTYFDSPIEIKEKDDEDDGDYVEIKLENGEKVLNWKLKEKFDRYYPMYEIAIIKKIQFLIKNHSWDLSKANYKNIISNILNEVLHLFYAFWDSLSPDEFEDILFWRWFKDNTPKKSQCWEEYKRKPISSESIVWTCNHAIERYQDLREHRDLLTMYKHFASEAIEHSEDEAWNSRVWFSNSLIKKKIENHFWDTIVSIADLFKQRFYSTNPDTKNLGLIYEEIKKILNYVSILKEKEIAFSELTLEDINNELFIKFREKIEEILPKKIELLAFKDLFFEKIDLEQDKIDLCERIINLRSLDILSTDFKELENIELNDLKFSDFSKAKPNVRKKYFLNKVLWVDNINWNIRKTWIPEIDWENQRIYNVFLQFYWFRYGPKKNNHWLDKEKTDKMIKSALSLVNKWTSLEDFEKNHIESEQIVIAWFRFYLIYKEEDSKLWEEITGEQRSRALYEAVKKEIDNMYWTRELIAQKIEEKWLNKAKLEKERKPLNIQILSWDKWHSNSSVWNIEKMLEINKKRFSHRPIKLDDEDSFWYTYEKDWVKEKRLFKETKPLYIPVNIGNPDKEQISDYLKSFLKYCNLVLQRKKISWNLSVYAWIINNLWIKENDYQTIWKLRKFLKYNLSIIDEVNKMNEENEWEIEFLEKLKWKLWFELEIWPKKNLARVMEKVVDSYNWDIRKLWDLIRARNVHEKYFWSIDNIVDFLATIKQIEEKDGEEYIKQIIIEDKTWHPSARANKATWYRDITLTLKTKSKKLIEIQFITKWIFDFKHEWLEIKDLMNIYKEEDIKFEAEELRELEHQAERTWNKIPLQFRSFAPRWFKKKGYLYQSMSKVSSDWFYNMWRSSMNDSYKAKMKRMEYLPYRKAWWNIVFDMSKDTLEEKIAA